MDSTELLLAEENTRQVSSEHLLYEDSSQEIDIFGDPPATPRLGKDYQVEVPPSELETKRLQLNPLAFAHETAIIDYKLGNAIPLIWVLDVKVGEEILHKSIELKGDRMTLVKNDLPEKTDYVPLPDAYGATWTDAEKESFLLGLYIFGKNLFRLKGFIGNKSMGDIISFYYGAFYRTDQHCRWSDCKKAKSRKCINGQRIFTGWRQNELLSRLSSRLSEESHRSLLEATKKFNESQSLENYVFQLKKIVGMKALVDGIAIGKGKDDLTDTALDPVKGNHSHSIHSEVPVGKACSSLSSSDIVKFLTGDYRLSKARSNDLFWEAVWPRLLDKGWHSEQPKEKGCTSLKHPLVFLVPGVRKFSRKKLVRGEHYFDSVSDVLCKVASTPSLLELGVDKASGSGINDDYALQEGPDIAKNGPSDCPRYSYLRPLILTSSSDFLKFTVVDTTLVQGEPPFKVRELRSLPDDNGFCHLPSSSSAETGTGSLKEHQSSSETSINHQDSTQVSEDQKSDENMEHVGGKRQQLDASGIIPNSLKAKRPKVRKAANNILPDVPNKKRIYRRGKFSKQKVLPPVAKRELNVRSYSETDDGRRYSGKNLLKSETAETNNEKPITAGVTSTAKADAHLLTEYSFIDKKSSKESMEISFENKCLNSVSVREMEMDEKPQERTLIDLNLPQFPPDFDISECTSSPNNVNISECSPLEMEQNRNNILEVGASDKVNTSEQSSTPRRQSTRNRPLTTRALEAMESGFLNTKRERGPRSSFSDAYRPSRRARKTAVASVSNSSIDNGNSVLRLTKSPVREKDDDCTSYSNESSLPTRSFFDEEGKGCGFDFFNIH